MTHYDIYEKFMIEYDKANITSSYPSLTKYEVATILDKAYLALIAQKLTGNNQRKVQFEGDIKAIEDLRPLVCTKKDIDQKENSYKQSSNDYVYDTPQDMLYYIQSTISRITRNMQAIDQKSHLLENVNLIDHNNASKYRATDTNLPWISTPVSYIEGDEIHVLVDSYKFKNDKDDKLNVTYLKKPAKFVDSGSVVEHDPSKPSSPTVSKFIIDTSKLNSQDKLG